MAVFRNPQFETIHLKTELKRNFIYLKQIGNVQVV